MISDSLQIEISKGRLIGPLDPSLFPAVHISSLGAIPKKHSENKWRLILDLSHPKGSSVNDGIARNMCSLTYMKVDDLVQKILQTGRGTLLAKIDIESAFRNIPVHPEDRHLLGLLWEDHLYVDTVLPFGLRSAPKIFNSVADALQWIARDRGISFLEHYLDDYVTAGAPDSAECESNLSLLIELCSYLGIPLAVSKQEGPTTCLIFLGIVVDTVLFELRLPAEKLLRLKLMLKRWSRYKFCNKKELESLVGHLHDASIVIKPGRTFTRRLIDLLKSAHRRSASSLLRLNAEARSDIAWWYYFTEKWNGLSMMRNARMSKPDIILTSDASGSWGCGAFWGDQWFQLQWPTAVSEYHITYKELFPVVVAVAIWGQLWADKVLLCYCDNEAVVSILETGTCKDPHVMTLLRSLFFVTAKYNILISALHIPGKHNIIADALSRNNMRVFFDAHPQALKSPQAIPATLMDLLVHRRPDWTSPNWTSMFNRLFEHPSLTAPSGAMPLASRDTRTSVLRAESLHSQPLKSCYAGSSAFSPDKASSTVHLNATYQESDFRRSSNLSQTHLSGTCPGSTMSSEASNWRKQRRVDPPCSDSQ